MLLSETTDGVTELNSSVVISVLGYVSNEKEKVSQFTKFHPFKT